MSNELQDPAGNINKRHEPELIQTERVNHVLRRHPSHVSKHHSGPPPCGDAERDFPINEEVDHTDYDLRDNSTANPVSKYWQLDVKLIVGREQTQHDVPAVEDERHADDVDDLVDLVVVELSIVVNHVVHVYALLAIMAIFAQTLQLLLD